MLLVMSRSVDSGVCATKAECLGMGDTRCMSHTLNRATDGDSLSPYVTNCNK